MNVESCMLKKGKSHKNTADLGKLCRQLGRKKADLGGTMRGVKSSGKAKSSSRGKPSAFPHSQ